MLVDWFSKGLLFLICSLGNCQCDWNEQNDSTHQGFATKTDTHSEEQVEHYNKSEFYFVPRCSLLDVNRDFHRFIKITASQVAICTDKVQNSYIIQIT